MTVEELRRKPEGVLDVRTFTLKQVDGHDIKEEYWLGKFSNEHYFIGFSEDGTDCSDLVSEEYMLKMMNDSKISDRAACEIYITDPHLSSWMD